MRSPYPLKALLHAALFFVSPFLSYAQNGSSCYQPVTGAGKGAAAIDGGVSIGFTSGHTPEKLINGNTADYVEIADLLGLLSGKGLTVTDSVNTYPAGWYAGFVVETGNTSLLSADALNGMQVQTWNNGALEETFTVNNGVGVTLLNGSIPGKIFLNFPTTRNFDEIRLVKGSLAHLSVGTSLRVYYAMAFDPNCGYAENNNICYDAIAGNGSIVNFNGGLLTSLATLSNPENLIDGNRSTYATMALPVRTNLLSTSPYVGVKNLQQVYPGGNKAGFKVQTSSGLLDATVLSSLSIQTYLHGVLQEEAVMSSGGLVNVNLLSGSTPIQELSITTTPGKPFNEVRLVQTGVSAAVNTLRIYEVFESGPSCSDCINALTTGASAPFKGKRLTSDRDGNFLNGNGREDLLGITLGSLTDRGNIVTPSLTDFAHFDAVVGIGGGFRMTVGTDDGATFPAGTVAGFAVSTGGGLLEANVIGGFTIKLYNNNTLVTTISGGSLVNLGLLSGSNNINFIGGKATGAFNEITIEYQSLISVGPDIDIYYAYAQLDTDGDGTADCVDACPSGSDALDSDGDGTPDDCDACDAVNAKSPYLDHDGDGITDACDPDSDGDGIPDATEDTNGDGDPTNDDTDGDGIPNYLDLDSDNDGIPDSVETSNDADGDGTPNYLDLDSDNDGMNDLTESGIPGAHDINQDGVIDGTDEDGDGIMTSADNDDHTFGSPGHPTPIDTDGDGTPDFLDVDSDNDGIPDITETGRSHLDNDHDGRIDDTTDADDDGIMDVLDRNDQVFGSPSLTILPFTLFDFTAVLRDHTALLRWNTSQERNSSYFLIERKTGGGSWETIGRTQAAGNSDAALAYQFSDPRPLAGKVQYRLRMTSLTGEVQLSAVRNLFLGRNTPVTLLTNPAINGTVQLGSGNYNGNAQLLISDLQGRIVKRTNARLTPGATVTVRVNGRPSQVYSILVVGAQGEKLLQEKLVIRN